MRIGWISAACYATTGYGKQSKEIIMGLIERGYEIYNIGGIGGETVWGGKINYPAKIHEENGKKIIDLEIPVLPTMGHLGGRDVAEHYIKRYGLDLIISLWDCFAIDYTGNLPIPAINYIPIDAPFTRQMYKYVQNAYKVVAYSKFGYQELLKWFPPTKIHWIPHGINCNVFKPISEKEKAKFRQTLTPTPVPEDAFLMVDVAANVGERKQLPLLMYALRKFFKRHRDAYIYLFLYASADVFVSTTIGEGFGIPTMEAQACGTPVIITNCSTSPELVGGHGWLVDTVPEDVYVFIPVWIPTLQVYPVPNMRSLLECLEDAYNHPEKVEEYGRISREFSLNYDWSRVIPRWDQMLKEVEEELNMIKSLAT